MKNKAIVFDLDGTLWDATKVLIQGWNFVLKKHGIKEIGYNQFCSAMGMNAEEVMNSYIFKGTPQDQRKRIMIEAEQMANLLLKKSSVKPYDGLKDSLDRLYKDFEFYIVSNCNPGYIETFIEVTKYGYYFDDFLCAGESKLSKGKNINTVLARNHISSAVFVGDRDSDMVAAKEAGVPFIHAAYGFQKDLKCENKINSPKDLVDMINKIYGTSY